MSKYSLNDASRRIAVRKVDPAPVQIATPAEHFGASSSFRYSSTEVSSHAGRTRVKARHARLEDGKFSMESFEGEFDGPVHGEILRRVHQLFHQRILTQMETFLRSLSWLSTRRTRANGD
jgi:hypothetical protein